MKHAIVALVPVYFAPMCDFFHSGREPGNHHHSAAIPSGCGSAA